MLDERLETASEAPARVSCVSDDRTALYRHFDAAGRLLYVGISLCALTRLGGHRAASHWFPEIATVTIEWHPTREAATLAESAAITQERPAYNLAGTSWASHWRVQQSAENLTRQIVSFRPAYTLEQAGKLLECGLIRFRRILEENGIRPRLAASREYVTGWDMIELLERLGDRAR